MRAEYRFTGAWVCLLLVLSACQALGVPTPQTFNQKLYVGYGGVTAVVTTTTALVQAKTITAADGKNIAAQADNVKDALDIAAQLNATDTSAGSTKLAAALTALGALQTYLCSKQPKGSGGCP